MDLESRNAALQSELNASALASLSIRHGDPKSWLPQRPKLSLQSHRDTINCLAFHPRFSSIASGSDDSTIKIWDWELGELEVTLKGHTKAVRDVDYGCPLGDALLASCSSDSTIKIWDPENSYTNIRTLHGHDHIVSSVRFIQHGPLLASSSKDGTIRMWNVTNGSCVRTLHGHTGWVRQISPSSDGNFLLSTGDDMSVRLWDVSANSENRLTLFGHDNFNECCAIAPQTSYQYLVPLTESNGLCGQRTAEFLASGSRDKTIKIWSRRGDCILTLIGHDNWVRAVLFHPGGRYLLSASDDRTLRCWDLSQQGKCVRTLKDLHSGFITCLKWAPSVTTNTEQSDGIADFSRKKANGKNVSDLQIRCLLATGSVDRKLQLYTE